MAGFFTLADTYGFNHPPSMIDILYLGRMFPKRCAVTAKKELKWVPFLGTLCVFLASQFSNRVVSPNAVSSSPVLRENSMWLSNSIFINRTNRADAVKTFSKAAKDMVKRKMSIFIFAEGTRTNREEIGMLPLKKGAFHLAVQGGFPIVPMVCENYYGLYAADKKRFEKGDLVIKGKCRGKQSLPGLFTVAVYQGREICHDTDCSRLQSSLVYRII